MARWSASTTRSAAGAALFFVAAPGIVAGLGPWALTHWRSGSPPLAEAELRVAGEAMLIAAVAVLLDAFVRFVAEGAGTPAPVAPTEKLVVSGLYRHVRNPMYVAVLAAIIAQALLLWRIELLAYAALAGLAMVAFVRGHEEPALHRRYGAVYDDYRAAVPGWWPSARCVARYRRPE